MLRQLPLKPVYRSEDDDLLRDFYIPAMQETVRYDRAVGYFSAAMISYAAQGISALIANSGRMRLIIGAELTLEETSAIEEGYEQKTLLEKLGQEFLETLTSVDDALFRERLKALSWLVASGRLDIRVAIRKRGMYHEKIGIFHDTSDDFVVFQGSANETASALLPDFNFESINVFPSWRTELQGHFQPYVDGFERLWNGTAKNTRTLEFPEALRDGLIRYSQGTRPPSPETEISLYRPQTDDHEHQEEKLLPRIPENFGSRPFELLDHQREALHAWKNGGFRGILALATGAGKTITSIFGLVRVFDAAQKRKQPLFCVIAVPYINLAEQWISVLHSFSIQALPCFGNRTSWEKNLQNTVMALLSGAVPFGCAVVVNRTLSGESFIKHLSPIPPESLFWIGDECHHHGAKRINKKLPKNSHYRIGLSATPEHYIDTQATERLTSFYGPVVSEYTLKDALTDDVLTPYKYYIHLVELTDDEAPAYIQLTRQISKYAARRVETLSEAEQSAYKQLLLKRARLIGSAKNKLPALAEAIEEDGPRPFTLVYCGDGSVEDDASGEEERQIELVSRLLNENGWKSARFTSRENPSLRREILDSFRVQALDAMVAIRCLDEGIDIPACRTAYILASARNPRQFIQRRGRILRKAENKDISEIHDFVVCLPEFDDEDLFEVEKNLLKSELQRIAEFSQLSTNPGDSYTVLEDLLARFDLEHIL
jgi:superfamily II DNA or RNA helicase